MGYIHEDVQRNHLARYPEEEKWLRAFLNGFDVTWGARMRSHNTDLSMYFLRPEPFMAETFGFTQELMLLYSPYATLEPRTLQAAELFLSERPANGRVEKLTYVVVSDSAQPYEWLKAYMAANQGSRIIIGMPSTELDLRSADQWFVRNCLMKQLFARDLFDYRLPIESDVYFFGREELLVDYLDAGRRGENRGLFGLRKTGKTSFLFKLARLHRDDGASVHYYDCKSPSVRQLRWHELLVRVASDLARQTGTAFKAPRATKQLAAKFDDLVASIPDGRRALLVFDEIEYISPLSPLDAHWREDYLPFWQTVWATQSAHRKMAVVVAGVNPGIVEADRFEGVQNPLFGIIPYRYLRGLGVDEVRRMLRVLGRRMGLAFPEESVQYMHRRYGGHPLLTRLAGSYTHRQMESAGEERPVEVSPGRLRTEEASRDAELSFYCRHVVSELKDFYPDEYAVLELLAAGRTGDYLEWASYPEYVHHLREYGLVSADETAPPTVTLSVVARYVALEEARRQGRQTILRVVPPAERDQWLARRTAGIIADIDQLERLAKSNGLPSLFGPTSFAESHRFASLRVVSDMDGFQSFITICNRCFVESCETYGTSIRHAKYFWSDIRTSYPAMFDALHRIKLYRHNQAHLHLNDAAESAWQTYLRQDLEGRAPAAVEELWFVLQQCVLDALLNALQAEIARLSQ